MNGLEGISPGRNVQLIPYVTARNFEVLQDDPIPRVVGEDLDADIGLDAKLVFRDSLALDLHRETRGKWEIHSRVPLETQTDLSVAYTPGVAAVSRAVAEDRSEAYALTMKGNSVAIISDGSATYCAYVDSVSSNSIGIDPPPAGGFTGVASTSGRAIPATIYELTGAGLTRNTELLSSKVEDFQVEFGLDTNGNGSIGSGEFLSMMGRTGRPFSRSISPWT